MFPKPIYKKKKKPRSFKAAAKNYCQYCGRSGRIIEVHHIEPKQMGGTWRKEVHSPDNAITLCRECHDRAHGIALPKISKDELREALKWNN